MEQHTSASPSTAFQPHGTSAHQDTFVRDRLPSPGSMADIDYGVLPELAAYPPQINCAVRLLDDNAARPGARTALVTDAEDWTYQRLYREANRIAHVLAERFEVKPGERVLLRSANNPMLVACWFAVMKVGAVAVATMPLLRERELATIAERAATRIALTDARLQPQLDAAKSLLSESTPGDVLQHIVAFNSAEVGALEGLARDRPSEFATVQTAADDPALIAFTSGTTGKPKGCVHYHHDVLAIADTFSQHILKPDADDVFAGSPPLAFTFGLGALVVFPFAVGAATYLREVYTPDTMLKALHDHRISVLFTAPTMYRALLSTMQDDLPATLTKCVSAGEALPQVTAEAWKARTGIGIIDGIGATEMLHIFIAAAGDDIRPGSTGKPIPGYAAEVQDDTGKRVPANVIGRLAVKGPTACRYLDDEERQQLYVQQGWNLTGDAYLVDEDGYFWYQSRTDDMIISAGYNISGPEIENVLLEHDAVKECAVVGLPDAARGQIVTAFVVLNDGHLPGWNLVEALQDFVKQTLAPYKYPRRIEFIEALPRTETGKVQRFRLRQSAIEGA